MQHLCNEKPNLAELKSLIHWTETTSIKPSQLQNYLFTLFTRRRNKKSKAKKPG